DYAIEGGRFLEAYESLMTDDYRISWMDRFPSREKLMAAIANGTTDEMAGDLSIMGLAGISVEDGEITFEPGERPNKSNREKWHCCKVSDEAAFCLIQRPYISKTLLTRRISPRGSP
ncbi:hypothetical protein JF955_22500, partial [Salmonella enterica subsp. enterica serovar London]|nr:hypothetical protein [Salmonella enterica subsp. enterica serovar London]